MDSLDVVNSRTRAAYNLAAQRYHDLFHEEMQEKEFDRRLLDSFALKFDTTSLICDAGCGPSGHIGRYMFYKGLQVIGVDISDKSIELARRYNPGMRFEREDIGAMTFADGTFDGILSYYSIINTPKIYVDRIFREFSRVLKPNGYVLVTVKAGTAEGYVDDLLGIRTKIFLALFTEQEIIQYLYHTGFAVESIERRDPYSFEINNERIFAIGRKSRR